MSNFIERKHCPACKSESMTTLLSAPFSDGFVWGYLERYYDEHGFIEKEYLEGGTFELVECNDCRLVFQKYIGNDDLLERLYTKWINPEYARSNDLLREDYFFYAKLAQEVMMFIRYFGKRPSELSFLDFGMGWAQWSLMAQGLGVKSFGAELSPDKIAYGKARGIEIVAYDDIPNHKFDLINTEQVFEHVSEPLEMLQHLRKGVRSGGLLKLSVPNGNEAKKSLTKIDWNAPQWASNSPMVVAPLEHINTYTTGALEAMGRKAGLVPIKIPVGTLIAAPGAKPKQSLKTFIHPLHRKWNWKGAYVVFRKP